MQWANSASRYGLVSILLHWLVALAVFGLFGLGLWMVGLDYYSSWYRTAPDLHKSIGLLLFAVMLARLLWRFVSPPPLSPASHGAATRLASRAGHVFLYVSMFVRMLSAYLIPHDDGRVIAVLGLCERPASLPGIPGQAAIAGRGHE